MLAVKTGGDNRAERKIMRGKPHTILYLSTLKSRLSFHRGFDFFMILCEMELKDVRIYFVGNSLLMQQYIFSLKIKKI